jgi:hypothetical protein
MNKAIILVMLTAAALQAQSPTPTASPSPTPTATINPAPKQPINNGILQSDLNAAGFRVFSMNMGDYAGVNMSWNSITGKFDSYGGGGSVGGVYDGPAPLTLHTTGKSNDPAHPYTALNSGFWVKDANNQEVMRIWATDPGYGGGSRNRNNTFVGQLAGSAQGTDITVYAGGDNTAVGARALRVSNTDSNTAVGSNAMQNTTTGWGNTAIGAFAFQANNTLEGSVAIGTSALKDSRQTGLSQGGDTAVGFASLFNLYSGGDNVAVGRYSGYYNLAESGCVFLGEFTQRSGGDFTIGLSNGIALGYQASFSKSNTAAIGNGAITDVYFGHPADSEAGNATLHAKSAIFGAITVATLPSPPTLGQIATVTDGATSLAWGTTVTGGGSAKYLVWYNGSNWTVIGK